MDQNIVFSVPDDGRSDEMTKSSYAGMVLRQVGNYQGEQSSQDVVFLPVKLSLNIQSYVEGQFFISPEIFNPQDSQQFSAMTFLGPWTSKHQAEISVTSPSGHIYQTKNTSQIEKFWSYQMNFTCTQNALIMHSLFQFFRCCNSKDLMNQEPGVTIFPWPGNLLAKLP